MKRKYLVGIPLWNCLDMVPWILEGIVKGFSPDRAGLVFLFSNTPPEVRDSFEKSEHLIKNFGRVVMATERDQWEGDNQNALMEYFMTTDADVLICPQDDHHWKSSRVVDDLDAALDRYGDRVGIIGGRDGYSYWLDGMVGSQYSDSARVGRRLAHGETAEAVMVNPGPMVFTRNTVETVGAYEDMPIFFFEDLCLRCNQAGKVNLCMGMDLVHKKFGRLRPMVNSGPTVANDLRRLNTKWRAILGHDVHG